MLDKEAGIARKRHSKQLYKSQKKPHKHYKATFSIPHQLAKGSTSKNKHDFGNGNRRK